MSLRRLGQAVDFSAVRACVGLLESVADEMHKASIHIGEQYGYRDYPQRAGSPLQRIEVLEQVRAGKWKV